MSEPTHRVISSAHLTEQQVRTRLEHAFFALDEFDEGLEMCDVEAGIDRMRLTYLTIINEMGREIRALRKKVSDKPLDPGDVL